MLETTVLQTNRWQTFLWLICECSEHVWVHEFKHAIEKQNQGGILWNFWSKCCAPGRPGRGTTIWWWHCLCGQCSRISSHRTHLRPPRIAITSRYLWADYVRTPPNKTPPRRTGKVMHAGSYYTRSANSGRSIPCHSASHVASCSLAGVKDVSGLGAGDSALIPQFLEAGTLDVTM